MDYLIFGQEHGPIEVAILAAFFILSVQELVPIAGMDKNQREVKHGWMGIKKAKYQTETSC
ncbi:hypothetical protein ACTHPJ_12080 [Paenibacillus amylolyticus]